MKKILLILILIILIPVLLYISIVVANNTLAKSIEKNLIAYSANSETSLAYQCANNEFADYGDAIRSNIDLLNEEAHTLANEAKSNLSATYRSAFITNVFIILIKNMKKICVQLKKDASVLHVAVTHALTSDTY